MTWIPAWQRRCGDSSCTYCLPETLTGEVGNVVAVNATEDGYELITPSGTGTVTSVAIAPTDGLEVDSGSPVTSAGTIALGVNASGLFQNAASGASRTYDYRVQCDGVTVDAAVTGTVVAFVSGQTLASTSVDAFSHTPSAASHTWTFQALASAASSVTLRRPKIKVYEVA